MPQLILELLFHHQMWQPTMMLLKSLTILSLSTTILNVTAFPNTRQPDKYSGDNNEKKIEKRQVPWLLPQTFQSFANPVFYPNNREGWRYTPCGPYPTFPQYTPPPPYPPATPPSSSDPNDILDRMGVSDGQTKPKKEPSRCVWAVVACCSPGSRDIRYSCFELLGCPGAFWDVNPCEDKVVMSAANSALTFYSDKNNGTSNSTSA